MIRSSFDERNLHRLFPLPAITFVALLMVFPVIYTLYLSFTNWTLTSGMPATFVGWRSYARVLTEPRFLNALARTFAFTFFAVAIEGVLGVAAALILNRAFVGKSVAKLLLLLPLVATPVAVGIVFNLFYDPTIGLANFVLQSFGLPPGLWVSNDKSVIPSLILVDVWQWTPMITLIVLAGLAGLSDEPVEAARIDGASEWQIYTHIILPLTAPGLAVTAIFAFQRYWNAFLWPLVVLQSPDLFTLQVGLSYIHTSEFGTNYGLLMSGAALAALPMIAFFFAFQRYFMQGLRIGALKG